MARAWQTRRGAAALSETGVRYQVTDRFIAAIKAERAAGTTQLELCRLVHMPPPLLSRWLHRQYSGQRRPHPENQHLKRLARVLDLPVDQCVEEVPDRP